MMRITLVDWNYNLAPHNDYLPSLLVFLLSRGSPSEQADIQIRYCRSNSFELCVNGQRQLITVTTENFQVLQQQNQAHSPFRLWAGKLDYKRDYYEFCFKQRYLLSMIQFYAEELPLPKHQHAELSAILQRYHGIELFSHLCQHWLNLEQAYFSQFRFGLYQIMIKKCLHAFVLHHSDRDVYALLYDLATYQWLIGQRRWYRGQFTSRHRYTAAQQLLRCCKAILSGVDDRLLLVKTLQTIRQQISAADSYLHHICQRHITLQQRQHRAMFESVFTQDSPAVIAQLLRQYTLQCYEDVVLLWGSTELIKFLTRLWQHLKKMCMTEVNRWSATEKLARQFFSFQPANPELAKWFVTLGTESATATTVRRVQQAYATSYTTCARLLKNRITQSQFIPWRALVRTVCTDIPQLDDSALKALCQSKLLSTITFSRPQLALRWQQQLLVRVAPWFAEQPIATLQQLRCWLDLDQMQAPALHRGLVSHCQDTLSQRGDVERWRQLAAQYTLAPQDTLRCWQRYAELALTQSRGRAWLVQLSDPERQCEQLCTGLNVADLVEVIQPQITLAACILDLPSHYAQLECKTIITTLNQSHHLTLAAFKQSLLRMLIEKLKTPKFLIPVEQRCAQLVQTYCRYFNSQQLVTNVLRLSGTTLLDVVPLYYSPYLTTLSNDGNRRQIQQLVRQHYRVYHYHWLSKFAYTLRCTQNGDLTLIKHLDCTLPFQLVALCETEELERILQEIERLVRDDKAPQLLQDYLKSARQILHHQPPAKNFASVCQRLKKWGVKQHKAPRLVASSGVSDRWANNEITSSGVPKGIRTPVAAVKGQCPRPLDDGDVKLWS
jgi:hypothetical protein